MPRDHDTARTMDKHDAISSPLHTTDRKKTARQREHDASVSYRVLPEKFVFLVLA
jgi:hypothetical protein